MGENIKPEFGPNPEQSERNRLVEEHRRLDAEFDAVESNVDSFFRRQGPYKSPEYDSEISELTKKLDEIIKEIERIEQALFDLDRARNRTS